MQTIAAYLLEQDDGPASTDGGRAFDRGLEVVRGWMRANGADRVDALRGRFRATDGGSGTFEWGAAEDGARAWKQLRVEETTAGTKYVTAVSLIDTGGGVTAYVTLEAGPGGAVIKPVRIDPRCPPIVRALLASGGDWYHGPTGVLPLQRLTGGEAGDTLARFVANPDRTLPVVAVSLDDRGAALPNLEEEIAHDLAGVANTFALDFAASWELTHAFGKRLSCYGGAVRIFWPQFSQYDNPFHHPLWVAERLWAVGDDARSTAEIFRRQLREMLMRTAALCVQQPAAVDAIRAAAQKRQVDKLLSEAASQNEFQSLAHAYALDNDTLRTRLAEATRCNRELASELEAVQTRLTNAEAMAPYLLPTEPRIEPVGPDDAAADPGPRRGEVRHYKNVGHTAKHDIMKAVADCGHNRWQTAGSADKARKGIKKLEGRDDWKSLQHCGVCQGGGVWRVKW